MIPTPPLRVRNRLAEIILAALDDAEARRELAALGAPGAAAPAWLEHDELAHGRLLRERAMSASAALAARSVGARIRSRSDVLGHHDPSSNVRRAASIARSASSGFESGTVAITSPVAGFVTSNRVPSAASTHSPSM